MLAQHANIICVKAITCLQHSRKANQIIGQRLITSALGQYPQLLCYVFAAHMLTWGLNAPNPLESRNLSLHQSKFILFHFASSQATCSKKLQMAAIQENQCHFNWCKVKFLQGTAMRNFTLAKYKPHITESSTCQTFCELVWKVLLCKILCHNLISFITISQAT